MRCRIRHNVQMRTILVIDDNPSVVTALEVLFSLRDIRTLMQQAQGRKSHLQDVGAYLLGLEPTLSFA